MVAAAEYIETNGLRTYYQVHSEGEPLLLGARRALPNVGGFDTACAAIKALWRTFAAELGSYGIRLVVVGSAGSPDVQESLELHARATERSFEEVLADSGSDTLLGRLPRVAEVARA